jgi:hypothetical protein
MVYSLRSSRAVEVTAATPMASPVVVATTPVTASVGAAVAPPFDAGTALVVRQ